MNARENAHRHMTWIIADKHLVDFKNRAELAIEGLGGNVRQIEINLVLTADAHAVNAHLKDLARRDVARNEIAVSLILFFKEIQTFTFGNRRRRPRVDSRT